MTTTMMTSVGGQPDIRRLTVRIPLEVGVSDGICSALAADDQILWKIFPMLNEWRTFTDGSTARKTMERVYRTLRRLDRNFVQELKDSVRSILKTYNALAVTSLCVTGRTQEEFDLLIERTRIDDTAFGIFEFLDVFDAAVKNDFDNMVLYAFGEFRKASLVEHIARYELDERLDTTESDVDNVQKLVIQNEKLQRLSKAFGKRFRLEWFNYFEHLRMINGKGHHTLTEETKPYFALLLHGLICKIWVNRVCLFFYYFE